MIAVSTTPENVNHAFAKRGDSDGASEPVGGGRFTDSRITDGQITDSQITISNGGDGCGFELQRGRRSADGACAG